MNFKDRLANLLSRKLIIAASSITLAAASGNVTEAIYVAIAYVLGQAVADSAKPVIDVLAQRNSTMQRLEAKMDEAEGK